MDISHDKRKNGKNIIEDEFKFRTRKIMKYDKEYWE